MPALSRRTFLASVGTAGLAGCLQATGEESSPTPTPTASPTATATPRPECPAVTNRPAPTDPSGEVGPTPYPDPPAEVTTGTVAHYVGAFERAYRRNRVVDNTRDLLDVGVGTPDPAVEPVDVGVRATLRYTYYYNTETVHADSPAIHVAYLVTDRVVYRIESEGHRTPDGGLDPRSGAIVACLAGSAAEG
jgi:hypothetical protein